MLYDGGGGVVVSNRYAGSGRIEDRSADDGMGYRDAVFFLCNQGSSVLCEGWSLSPTGQRGGKDEPTTFIVVVYWT